MTRRSFRYACLSLLVVATAVLPASAVRAQRPGRRARRRRHSQRDDPDRDARHDRQRHRRASATARSPPSARTCRFPPAPRSSTAPASSSRPASSTAHSHIANDAINEGTIAVSSMTGMEDVLNPTDINIYRDLAGGTTTANILHGSANPIGGKTVVIKLRWGKTRPEDLLFAGRAARHQVRARRERQAAAAADAARGPRRYPTTRQGVEYVIRDAFTRAKVYQKAWQDYRRRRRPRAPTCCRRSATCSSTRSSRSSRASGSCTRTATAPTRS